MKHTAPPLVPRSMRLSITLSDRCSNLRADVFRERLHHYIQGSGLALSIRETALHLSSTDQPISPFEHSLLLSWIASQPEVVLVRVERPGRLAASMANVRPCRKGTDHGHA